MKTNVPTVPHSRIHRPHARIHRGQIRAAKETNVPTLSLNKMGDVGRPFIVRFQISQKDAADSYLCWVKKQSCHRLNDLDITGNQDKIEGIYVPAWLFEVSAKSPWHGRNYHTEYRTVTKSRYVSGKGWEDYTDSEGYDVPDPVSSTHNRDYLLPVPASNGITQREIETLKLKRSELQSYDESYLDGWRVQAGDLDKTEAQEICERRIKELEVQACEKEVYELVGCSTTMAWKASYFVLLPLFVLTYTYKGHTYFNLIDGRTGAVQGDIPINQAKKFLFTVVQVIVGGIVGLVLAGVLIFLISR